MKEYHVDLETVLKNPSRYNLPQYYPCLQCHEEQMFVTRSKNGCGQEADMGVNHTTYQIGGRCCKCGEQLTTPASLVASTKEMRDIITQNKLIIHDVVSDGNCLFAAVNDQLRIQGNFDFSFDELRQEAVNYLTENPNAEDGTPYSMFLTNESWREYLERMRLWGQWGDHIILHALADILQRTIIIYGGLTGKQITHIPPKRKREDTHATGDNQIYIGHISQTHYVSLRPRNWHSKSWLDPEDNINDEISKQQEDKNKSYPPIEHVNFLLTLAFKEGCIQSHDEAMAVTLAHFYEDYHQYESCIVGSFINKTIPDIYPRNIDSGFDGLFPMDRSNMPKSTPVLLFYTPKDTKITQECASADPFDLIIDGKVCDGPFRLLPKRPKAWKNKTVNKDDRRVLVNFTTDPTQDLYLGLNLSFWSKIWNRAIVPIIAFRMEWPGVAMEWVTRNRPSGNLNGPAIQDIYDAGCHVLPVYGGQDYSEILSDSVPNYESEDETLWVLSFAVAEKKIWRHTTQDQRCCFLVFQCLVDLMFGKHTAFRHAIAASIFYYAWENIDKDEWKHHPGNCIFILAKHLRKGLADGHVPHYFIAGKNILQNIPETTIDDIFDKTRSHLSDPVSFLYKTLNRMNVSNGHMSELVDEVIADMRNYVEHSDMKKSVNEVFLPAVNSVVQAMIAGGKYSSAFSTVQIVSSQLSAISGEAFSIQQLAFSAIEELDIRCKWGFTLFMDISMGTHLTGIVCDSMSQIHISEVFGPKAVKLVCDTCLPKQAAIEYGDVEYAHVLVDVLKALGTGVHLIPCLKYYIQTYTRLAGNATVVPFRADISPSNMFRQPTAYDDMTASQRMISSLHNLYVDLYNTCHWHSRIEEFRSFFPQYKVIAELQNSVTSRNNIKLFKNTLGICDTDEWVESGIDVD